MGLLSGLFNVIDDIVSIPTDLVGITNHYEKKKILTEAKRRFLNDELSSLEYEKIKEYLK